jgi:A/G-specific adenine glycosylase
VTLAGPVLAWGLPRLRDLPWRHTRDPWAVLVSEVMLQQTQVARVVPKWHAFLAEFPTTAACAAASLGDVLRLWQGLGYPRRARNLQAAAIEVERRGAFPRSLDELLTLPGVGAYTARAVLAFAYEDDAAVVDTNIARVHARLAGRTLTAREVQQLADDALPMGQAWEWNQCIMDLGAVLCRPSTPSCGECPLRPQCAWHGDGIDPAVGSASVSRTQAPFDGSDRQARGRLLKALVAGDVPVDGIADVMGRDRDRALRLLADLEGEGLVTRADGRVRLP